MKKTYMAPDVYFEGYELSQSVAACDPTGKAMYDQIKSESKDYAFMQEEGCIIHENTNINDNWLSWIFGQISGVSQTIGKIQTWKTTYYDHGTAFTS